MHGKILDYNSDIKSGFLRDEDEKKYHYFIGDCTNPEKLQMGAEVDFEPDGERATKINVLEPFIDPNEVSISNAKLAMKISVKRSKKFMSVVMILTLIAGIGALIVTLTISEMEQRKLENLQNIYDSQIRNIEKYISERNCSEAATEYARAGSTRSKIYKQGSYYSFQTHAVQAHAIDIAECFAQRKDFINATGMLDIKRTNDIDYLRRAANVYKKSGDNSKAAEAKYKAEKYVPIQ